MQPASPLQVGAFVKNFNYEMMMSPYNGVNIRHVQDPPKGTHAPPKNFVACSPWRHTGTSDLSVHGSSMGSRQYRVWCCHHCRVLARLRPGFTSQPRRVGFGPGAGAPVPR